MSHVRCLFSHLVARCKERGHDIHSAMACITEISGDYIIVNTEHPAYPKSVQNTIDDLKKITAAPDAITTKNSVNHDSRKRKPIATHTGAGTELKKLLAKIGIKASPTCSCNKRAQIMDEKGIEWCKENIDIIVGWLREEATKRRLPFVDFAGKLLVQRAISLAEKDEKKQLAAQQQDQTQDG